MVGQVEVADGAFVVEGEDDLASGGFERGPALGLDRLAEGVVRASDVVGGEELAGLEDRADLGVDRVQLGLAERRREGR